MAGGSHPKSASSHNPSPSSSSSLRKSRWESDHKPSDKKPSSSSAAAAAKPPTPKPTSNPKENPKPTSKPIPTPPTDPNPHPGFAPINPPPPPSYGFHMLERRTIALADGSVRSYFALPPDYENFAPPPPRPMLPAQGGLGFGGRGFPLLGPMSPEFRDREDLFARDRNEGYLNLLKRKGGAGEDERGGGRDGSNDEFMRQRQHLLQYGNAGSMNPDRFPVGLNERGEFVAGPSNNPDGGRGEEFRAAKYMRTGGGYENFRGGDNVGLKHNDVDQSALKKAFLHFVKLLNENTSEKKNYLENGKQAPLHCVACGRSSKDFPDMHGLILHTYNPDKADLLVDHLGLHKALCVLMGWNYSKPPDSSRAYQSLSAEEAAANQDDLIMWPPTVLIHNTHTGKVKDGRLEGLGNKAMDNILRGLGFGSGKAKSVFGREGHSGVVRVQFAGNQSGLKEALRLAEFLQKENHGRMNWARVQSLTAGKDIENDPNLVKVDEKTGEKARILYGYLGTAWDLDKMDFDARKKTAIESRREHKPS
ncbi:hypothetical protein RHSIM_Rhsim04G0202200 [Rhododendron simsii]|uniref:XS domain-containing protein n=1 Tax=Rhododendron simsii TaxID=118357 RepID=A0A834LQP5_RHOSS|nr:hypothetical protein RHSIM_Rhsim04G0202200 [Rhododendron simsii]